MAKAFFFMTVRRPCFLSLSFFFFSPLLCSALLCGMITQSEPLHFNPPYLVSLKSSPLSVCLPSAITFSTPSPPPTPFSPSEAEAVAGLLLADPQGRVLDAVGYGAEIDPVRPFKPPT